MLSVDAIVTSKRLHKIKQNMYVVSLYDLNNSFIVIILFRGCKNGYIKCKILKLYTFFVVPPKSTVKKGCTDKAKLDLLVQSPPPLNLGIDGFMCLPKHGSG